MRGRVVVAATVIYLAARERITQAIRCGMGQAAWHGLGLAVASRGLRLRL